MIEAQLLRYVDDYLHYDSTTGIFTWKVSRGRAKAGDTAGRIETKGKGNLPRRYLFLLGKQYVASRIAYLMVHRHLPKHQIDHIDHDTLNDRITNLRDVPQLDNCKNKKLHRNNASGVSGVHYDTRREKWRASIRLNKKFIHLGFFDSFDKARTARKEAESIYGYHPNHGK